MEIYKCHECGAEFTEPRQETYYELHSELDEGNKYEKLTEEHCPECGSTDIEGGYYCECCGERYGEYHENGWFCPDCIQEVDYAVDALQSALKTDWKSVVKLVCAWSEHHW